MTHEALLACEWCDELTAEDGTKNACMIAHCLDCIATCRHCQDDIREEGDV